MTQEQIDAIRARAEAATELIDELHTERISYPEYLTLRDGIDDVDDLLAEIEQLREALKGAQVIANQAGEIIRNSSWIPVSERWPDVGGHVLVVYDDGFMLTSTVDEFDHGVTHWMPLPAPPNTEEKEA